MINLFPPPKNALGVPATSKEFEAYEVPEMPKSGSHGKFPTLNQTGYMTFNHDPFSLEFIDHCGKGKTVLEIGSAYGISTIPALEKGATVVANDIDPRHLLVLRSKTPRQYLKDLYLKLGSVHDELELPDNTFDSVLICRVLHLFTPKMIEATLAKVLKWLKSGGHVYITAMTPYHIGMKNFLKTYNEKWEKGNLWPGEVVNLYNYFPEVVGDLPKYAHMMEEKSLIAALKRHGYAIGKYMYYDTPRPDNLKRTGKEYFGIIGTKNKD